MPKTQRMATVRLETPVECGIPECDAMTQDTLFESVGRGYYTTIELAPFCAAHRAEMEYRWQRRYGPADLPRPRRRKPKTTGSEGEA